MGYCLQRCGKYGDLPALRTSGARDFGLSGEVDVDQLVKISEINRTGGT